MIYIYPEQLKEKLTKKLNYYCYVLFGNDPMLLEDTKISILQYLKSFDSYECFNFSLNNSSSWTKIILTYQTKSLFFHKKKFSYLLYLKENLIKIYSKKYLI